MTQVTTEAWKSNAVGWAAAQSYTANSSVVVQGGAQWKCIKSHTSAAASMPGLNDTAGATADTYWELIVVDEGLTPTTS